MSAYLHRRLVKLFLHLIGPLILSYCYTTDKPPNLNSGWARGWNYEYQIYCGHVALARSAGSDQAEHQIWAHSHS